MDIHLLNRYFENKCTLEERQQVIHWLSDEANKQEAIRLMEGLWIDELKTKQEEKRIVSQIGKFRWRAAAAIVGLVIGISAIFLLYQNPPTSDRTLADRIVSVSETANELATDSATNNVRSDAVPSGLAMVVDDTINAGQRHVKRLGQSGQTNAPADSKAVKAIALREAKLVNEQKFVELLAGLDSASLTHLFTFQNARLKDILGDIQRKFNLEITVCDESLNSLVVQKDFDAVNLYELLFHLRKQMDLTYSVQNNRILICAK